jgi:hypothetical protein
MSMFAIAMTMTILAAGGAGAREIALEDVPANILAAAERVAPGLKFHRVSIEDGSEVYEFESFGPRGEHMEIDIAADGGLEEIEMQIDPATLPQAVKAALNRRSPGFTIVYVEASVRPDGVYVYEIEGEASSGDMIAIDIREDGEVLGVEGVAVS